MLNVDLEIDVSQFHEDTERERLAFLGRLTLAVEQVLKRKAGNIWPTGNTPTSSGFSYRRFVAEEEDGDILITNSAPYAKFVNNMKEFKSGAANRNYRAVQRTIEANWNAIIRKADARGAA